MQWSQQNSWNKSTMMRQSVCLPSGGCNMPPFFSQLPIGWISEESTRRQKSFLLSDPSKRSLSREPVRPTTVAMQVDVVFRGSWASSFIPALNSLSGGVRLWMVTTDKNYSWHNNNSRGRGRGESRIIKLSMLTCLKQDEGAATAPVSFRYFSQLKWPAGEQEEKQKIHIIWA